MGYLFLIFFFFFGAALGSFVLVVANRFNTGLSPLKGRSICFSCQNVLNHLDLVPIFSFLSLKGRCRYCGGKIPKESLVAELLMGIISILLVSKIGLSSFFVSWFSILNYFLLLLIFAVILLIAIYDLRHFIIPDGFLIWLLFLSFVYNILSAFNFSPIFIFHMFINLLISGVVLALPFFLIFLVSKGAWFGFGDVKYIFAIGFFLGLIFGLSAVVLAFWIGAAFAVTILLLNCLKIYLPRFGNNLTIKSEIPFGPFLSIGLFLSFYFNIDLFHLYSLFNVF